MADLLLDCQSIRLPGLPVYGDRYRRTAVGILLALDAGDVAAIALLDLSAARCSILWTKRFFYSACRLPLV